jgi:hypothetical protein
MTLKAARPAIPIVADSPVANNSLLRTCPSIAWTLLVVSDVEFRGASGIETDRLEGRDLRAPDAAREEVPIIPDLLTHLLFPFVAISDMFYRYKTASGDRHGIGLTAKCIGGLFSQTLIS